MTRRMATLATVLTFLCAVCMPIMAAAQTDPPPPPPTSSLIVKLVAGLSADEQAAVIARNGGVEISTIAALRLHVIQVPTDELATTLAAYQADPQVIRAEENKTRRSEAAPADPLYVSQWALPQIAWDQVFG
ncbi:MAG: S8 family serine peptidase, partial [bacterium]